MVEDDPGCRALIVELLERIGCTVEEAASGSEALVLAKADRPALVLLDVGIPGVTGYEVCHELRETYGHTLPIVFISGSRVESQDRVAGLLIGADDYIVKPFDGDELVARVRRLLVRNSDDARHIERRKRRSTSLASLTTREREVLVLLAHGRNQKQIAAELFISPKTVGRTSSASSGSWVSTAAPRRSRSRTASGSRPTRGRTRPPPRPSPSTGSESPR